MVGSPSMPCLVPYNFVAHSGKSVTPDRKKWFSRCRLRLAARDDVCSSVEKQHRGWCVGTRLATSAYDSLCARPAGRVAGTCTSSRLSIGADVAAFGSTYYGSSFGPPLDREGVLRYGFSFARRVETRSVLVLLHDVWWT